LYAHMNNKRKMKKKIKVLCNSEKKKEITMVTHGDFHSLKSLIL
jgi:hypothetical protein